jgi:hypothetical protein
LLIGGWIGDLAPASSDGLANSPSSALSSGTALPASEVLRKLCTLIERRLPLSKLLVGRTASKLDFGEAEAEPV